MSSECWHKTKSEMSSDIQLWQVICFLTHQTWKRYSTIIQYPSEFVNICRRVKNDEMPKIVHIYCSFILTVLFRSISCVLPCMFCLFYSISYVLSVGSRKSPYRVLQRKSVSVHFFSSSNISETDFLLQHPLHIQSKASPIIGQHL